MKPQNAAILALLREQGAEGYVITSYDHKTATGKHVAKYVLRWHLPLSELEMRYAAGDR